MWQVFFARFERFLLMELFLYCLSEFNDNLKSTNILLDKMEYFCDIYYQDAKPICKLLIC